MRQNKKIAITGGIGSGKSTVARLIAERGYDVFSCDLIAHEIYEEPNVVREILREFPDCATDGLPDRKKLSAAVFREKERLRALEKITHPAIMRKLYARMEKALSDSVFAEVPLLFEGGYQKDFDGVIVVLREKSARIGAVAVRDGLSEEEVERRIKNQFDYENKSIFEHTVLYNDGDLAKLREKVGSVLEKFENK